MTSMSQPNILALSPVTCLHHILCHSFSLCNFVYAISSTWNVLPHHLPRFLNSSELISNDLPFMKSFVETPSGRFFLLWDLQNTEIYIGGHYLMLPRIKISPSCHIVIRLRADTLLCFMHLCISSAQYPKHFWRSVSIWWMSAYVLFLVIFVYISSEPSVSPHRDLKNK